MPRIYDVTVPLSAALPTFPGDPRFEMEFAHRIADGKPYNVAYLKMGAHAGTHVDAPYHFLEDGMTVDRLPLEVLMGPARVVAVESRDRIRREDVEGLDLSEVAPGDYDLACLPLRIEGADGSPARAVLTSR